MAGDPSSSVAEASSSSWWWWSSSGRGGRRRLAVGPRRRGGAGERVGPRSDRNRRHVPGPIRNVVGQRCRARADRVWSGDRRAGGLEVELQRLGAVVVDAAGCRSLGSCTRRSPEPTRAPVEAWWWWSSWWSWSSSQYHLDGEVDRVGPRSSRRLDAGRGGHQSHDHGEGSDRPCVTRGVLRCQRQPHCGLRTALTDHQCRRRRSRGLHYLRPTSATSVSNLSGWRVSTIRIWPTTWPVLPGADLVVESGGQPRGRTASDAARYRRQAADRCCAHRSQVRCPSPCRARTLRSELRPRSMDRDVDGGRPCLRDAKDERVEVDADAQRFRERAVSRASRRPRARARRNHPAQECSGGPRGGSAHRLLRLARRAAVCWSSRSPLVCGMVGRGSAGHLSR